MHGVGLSAVVPAAGRAERFGGAKLIADLDGEPLLTHTLRSLLNGGVRAVVVVASRETELGGVALLADSRVVVVINPDPGRGMFSSIQIGLAAAAEGRTVLVLPGDMPFVQSTTVAAVAARSADADAVVVPMHAGRHGHPVALPERLRGPLRAAAATSNLKAALAGLGAPIELAVDDPGVLRDVDVRADLRSPPF